MLKIGIDAMGGDYAPTAVVQGALMALAEIDAKSGIVLFGDRAEIERLLLASGEPEDRFTIVATTEVIGMSDHPAQAFAKKSDASIVVGFKYLAAKKIDGFASAGNTGAMMVGCMHAIKPIEGVIRPGISSTLPTLQGGHAILMDVGLNVDCKPEVLHQYGMIGSVYAKSVLGIQKPRVALLNIGEEREKGNLQTRAAYELMEGSDRFHFVGNIEAKQLLTGEIADVIVCDGFVGNTILKQAEGFHAMAQQRNLKDEYIDQLNYENIGGTPVLGIHAPVIVGHGSSTSLAIKNMILQTEKAIRAALPEQLQAMFK